MATVKLIQDTKKSLIGALHDGDLPKANAILRDIPSLVSNSDSLPFLHVAVDAPTNSRRLVCLLLKAGVPINYPNAIGATALHIAAGKGNKKCLVELLRAGADVHQCDKNGLIPLHYAARSRCEDSVACLQLLLAHNSPCNIPANHGYTPLHVAAEVGNVPAVRILLNAGALHSSADYRGQTALHLATVPAVAEALLDAGADVTEANTAEESVLEHAIKKSPAVVPTLLASGMAVRGDLYDSHLRVFFNLDILCDSSRNEVSLLNIMSRRGQYDFLKHPLCETFLHLKWLRVWPLFYLKLAVFISLVLTLTSSLCLRSYLPREPNLTTKNETSFEERRNHTAILITATVLQGLSGVLWAIVMCREIMQVIISREYWSKCEKWLQLPFIILSVLVIATTGPLEPWQRHVGVIVVLLGWFKVTFLIGHLPSVGLYVQMFLSVSVRMLTFACVYSSLFIGFSVSFYLVFEGEVFSTIWMSVLKTLAMMVGELEVASILGKDTEQTLPGTAHVIFVLFVLLMTIVITNLLVGLAVQDIQMLQKEAGVSRLALTVEQETSVDIMLSSRLVSWIMPYQLHTWLRNKCSLLHHLPQRSLHVPNACNQISDSDASVDWWIRQGTRSQQRGPMEHYNIFIRPYDPTKPGKVYFSNVTKLIPTSYTLPDWIIRNTRLLIENGLHNRESEADLVTDDGEDEAEDTDTANEIQSTTLENMQEQLNELQKSVTVMSQMMKKILNSK
ncbi:transient receptor potential channel pyrexia-like isoform X2 [Macrobrachium rosenbergii]|uniref:transient receptor potential channel pyrexia-like isoform X2 n=1 Tax=Macrobrachium rosenbergii TaxID=79674 RepID=UPI0034D6BA45